MARCQYQRFIGRDIDNAVWEMCGKPATYVGKMPFATHPEYRCDEHASELACKMPLRGNKQPRTLSDAQQG